MLDFKQMITIGEITKQLIQKIPFIEEALSEDLINISSLARKLHPDIEKALVKKVQVGAIAMAIKRMDREEHHQFNKGLRKFVDNLGDFIVRSSLMHYTFENSKSLIFKQRELLNSIAGEQIYYSVSGGINETTLVVSKSTSFLVEEIFKDEKLIFQKKGLASITLQLPKKREQTMGFYYFVLKNMALANINIEELISTTNEFTILVKENDIDRAFAVLMELKKGL